MRHAEYQAAHEIADLIAAHADGNYSTTRDTVCNRADLPEACLESQRRTNIYNILCKIIRAPTPTSLC